METFIGILIVVGIVAGAYYGYKRVKFGSGGASGGGSKGQPGTRPK